MSVIKRKPFIEKVCETLTKPQLNMLKNQLNISGNTILNKHISEVENGINTYVLKLNEFLVLPCICIRNSSYSVALNYGDNQSINIYNLNVTTGTYTKIKEYLTISELRRVIQETIVGTGSEIITLLYDDTTLGAPDSAKVDAFVRSQGIQEQQFGNVRVVIQTTKIVWTHVTLPTPQWIGGGSDIVDPFTNTSQGTVIGVENDGYVEHLATDPNGVGHVHGFDDVKTTANNALPKSGGTMTGDLIMGNHIINMGGASIKNLGNGTDDDALSLKAAKARFVYMHGSMSGSIAYTRVNGTETAMTLSQDVQANSVVERTITGKIKSNAGVDNDDVVNVGQLSTTLTSYLLKDTTTSVFNRVYSVDTTGSNKLMQIDNNFSVSNNHNLADIESIKSFVNSSITASAANYVTSDAVGNNFPTRARLLSGPWFNKGVSYTPQTNDYAIVANDETHGNNQCRYSYDGTQWAYQYTLNVPFTAAQQAAIDSGINSSLVSSYNAYATNKMEKADGVGTGTTKLENLILSGDMTFQSGADVDFTNAGVDLGNNAVTATPTDSSNEKVVANKEYVDAKVVRKSGVPSSVTAGLLGQLYIDLSSGKHYVCTKIDTTTTPTSYTWSLNEFVPLTGTIENKPITGNLIFQVANKSATEPSADLVLGSKHNNMAIKVWGGTNYSTGAFIEAYGSDAQVEWGGSLQQRHGWLVFGVPTLDGTGYTKEAYLKPDGTFTFDDKNIVKIDGAGTSGQLVIASPTSGVPGWSYTSTLSNSIKLNGNEIIESLSGAGYVLTGKNNSSYITLLGGSVDGATINLTGKDHSYKGTLELIGRDGTTNETKMTIGVDKGVHYITRSYTNQSRETLFSLSTTMDETLILSSVKFSAEDSPLGSADAQFEVEIHNTGLQIGKYGYILAKNRNGFYLSNLDNGTWGDWGVFGDVSSRVKKVNSGNVTLIKASSDTASNRFVITAGTTDVDSCLIMKNKTASGGAGAWLRSADNNDTTNTKIHAFMVNGDGSVRFGSGAPSALAWTGTNATGIIGDSGWATIESSKIGDSRITGTFKIRIKNGWVYISGTDINVTQSSTTVNTMILLKNLNSITINQILYSCGLPSGYPEARGIMKTNYGTDFFSGAYMGGGGDSIVLQCDKKSISSQMGRFDMMYPYQ